MVGSFANLLYRMAWCSAARQGPNSRDGRLLKVPQNGFRPLEIAARYSSPGAQKLLPEPFPPLEVLKIPRAKKQNSTPKKSKFNALSFEGSARLVGLMSEPSGRLARLWAIRLFLLAKHSVKWHFEKAKRANKNLSDNNPTSRAYPLPEILRWNLRFFTTRFCDSHYRFERVMTGSRTRRIAPGGEHAQHQPHAPEMYGSMRSPRSARGELFKFEWSCPA